MKIQRGSATQHARLFIGLNAIVGGSLYAAELFSLDFHAEENSFLNSANFDKFQEFTTY